MEVLTIYYDDNKNSFEDEDGIEYGISCLMSFDDIMYYKQVGGTYHTKLDDELFDVEFPIPLSLDRVLIYFSQDNTFMVENDELMFNIFSLITPNDLLLFKHNKKNICIQGVQGGDITLIYLE